MNGSTFYAPYLRIINLRKHPLLYVVVISILLRYAIGMYTSWTFDVETWYRTVTSVLAGSDLYDRFYFVYPPIWGYILWASAKIASLFFDPATFGYQIQSGTIYSPVFRFEIVTSPLFNVIFKTPLIISDILVGILIYNFIHKLTDDTKKSKVGFMVWTFNPLVISISSIHGTFDTIATLFALIAVILAYRYTYFWSGAALALGTLTKIFPVFLIPVVIGFIFSSKYILKDRFIIRKNLLFILGFTSVILIIVSPYLIRGTYTNLINVLLTRNEAIEPGGLSVWILLLTYFPSQYNQLLEGNLNLMVLVSTIIISISAYLIGITGSRSNGKLVRIFLASIVVLSFVYLLSPVLLPQYLLWVFPFLIITYLCFVRTYKYPFIILSATGLIYFYSVHGIWHLFYPLAVFTDSVNFDSITTITTIYLNTRGLLTPYLHTDVILAIALITICVLISMIFLYFTKFQSRKSTGLTA